MYHPTKEQMAAKQKRYYWKHIERCRESNRIKHALLRAANSGKFRASFRRSWAKYKDKYNANKRQQRNIDFYNKGFSLADLYNYFGTQQLNNEYGILIKLYRQLRKEIKNYG